MEHLGTKELQTKRLILRRLTIDDTESVYNNWANDNEVTRYLSWQTHEDKVEINVPIYPNQGFTLRWDFN